MTSLEGVRFAPSPTGNFHLGNLRTGWISWRFARHFSEPWVVRFEDIDRPRVIPGAMDAQLRDLALLSLVPDQILIQSDFHSRHWGLFAKAAAIGKVYPCFCSRKEVQLALAEIESASAPHGRAPTYNGHCRPRVATPISDLRISAGWRFRMDDESGVSDFLVARTFADGKPFIPSYSWACAIDDYDGGYRLLVRASDLVSVAAPQRAIQSWLNGLSAGKNVALPALFYTSLVTQNDGHRLEKRTPGVTLSELLSSGLTPGKIIERFERSFDSTLLSRCGEDYGEPRAEISLRELGF
ncbi:MAG: glutamate--tRNA ligase family protein [Oligoflexia bacterium]|nr:glutamate--tRNA ligase family protein [Oligoflexia bacterium]